MNYTEDLYLIQLMNKLDELERRVDMVGRNGNDGIHYQLAGDETAAHQPVDYAKKNAST